MATVAVPLSVAPPPVIDAVTFTPAWLTALSDLQLLRTADANGDGAIGAAELLIGRDGIALALPSATGLPYVLTALMAAAALETKTVMPDTKIRCTGGYQFGKRLFKDWKAGGHGPMDIRQAIVHSCDVFFYTVGQRMGIDTIASYAGQFGLGRETGLELPSERTGIVPSTAWKEKTRHEPWWPGETVSASIGQGYVTVTPLQMAHLTATVANNGVAFRPHLVRGIKTRAAGTYREFEPVETGRVTVKPETLALIQEAMAGVVTHGTATRAKSNVVTIAGKTGTAQTAALRTGPEKDIPKKLRDHAWFVSYAPVEAPRIAVAVLVEHMGHGGTAAAPLAKQMIETYMRLTDPQPGTGEADAAADPSVGTVAVMEAPE